MWSATSSFSLQYPIPTFPLITSLLFLYLSLSLLLKFTKKPRRRPPPSPPTFPVIGNLHQLGLHPHRSLQKLAQKHGPIILLHLGRTPTLIISSPETARRIMKTHDLIFSDRPITRIKQILLYGQNDVATAPYGEYWRQMKSLCVLHLLSNKRVQSYRDIRDQETDSTIEEIKRVSSSSCPVINLSEVFAEMTSGITCRAALGQKYKGTERGRSFKGILLEYMELLGGFDVGDFIPWLGWVSRAKGLYSKAEKLAEEMDEFLDRVVDEHERRGNWKSEGRNKDFVDVLIWVQKEDMAGFHVDATAIKAIILDVFAAGTDTTYTVLEWAMTELLIHPKTMKKLQNEIRELINNKSNISEDDLIEMPFLKAVVKETLRLHPPIPLLVPRVATQDVKINGFDIAAGTQVFINSYAIGRDPTSWDRADEFLPERFLDSGIDFKGQNFELIPFGSGRRICPGIQFAVVTIELALAKLLYKFDLKFHDLTGLDMRECTGLTAHRKTPLYVVATSYCSI